MDYMEIPKLRLQRAREHLHRFEYEAGEFLRTDPYRVVKERCTENGQGLALLVNDKPLSDSPASSISINPGEASGAYVYCGGPADM
ncbi:MAG: hypothetical protein HY684_06585 [Chloroflexi bacterium]|nr:hypothetical protein [Chloroflexota bacterium]